jgi:hypothetical protein
MVVGGEKNIISGGTHSFIGGGRCNLNLGNRSTIGGGLCNTIFVGVGKNATRNSTIAGGSYNIICQNSIGSTIGGGSKNTSSDNYSFIGGGLCNISSGGLSFIGGGCNNQVDYGASIIGGTCNTSLGNQSVIGGGISNTICSWRSFIGSGRFNSISGTTDYSSVVGGKQNIISDGTYSFIGGGCQNVISGGTHSFIGGGHLNRISGNTSTIVGGCCNVVIGHRANKTYGGKCNVIIGRCAGYANPYNSVIIIGTDVSVTDNYHIVWGNSNNNVYNCVWGGWSYFSDARDKTDIEPLTCNTGIKFIKKLRPVSFNFDNRKNYVDKCNFTYGQKDGTLAVEKKEYGFIAQELKQALEELNITDFDALKYNEDKDAYRLSYTSFLAPLTKAIQELDERTQALKLKIGI